MIYFFVGLSINDGASVINYLVFLALMFSVALTSQLFFSVYATCVSDVTTAQACMAITAVIFVLFSGFTVQPNVIPDYWIWAYWYETLDFDCVQTFDVFCLANQRNQISVSQGKLFCLVFSGFCD